MASIRADPFELGNSSKIVCSDANCPVTSLHEAGSYDLRYKSQGYNSEGAEGHENKQIPFAVRDALRNIATMRKKSFAEITAQEWETAEKLAKFSVVHECHKQPLMPAEITEKLIWWHHKVTKILKTGPDTVPVKDHTLVASTPATQAPEAPAPGTSAKKEVAKSKEGRPTRRGLGPGRGDTPFTKPLPPFDLNN